MGDEYGRLSYVKPRRSNQQKPTRHLFVLNVVAEAEEIARHFSQFGSVTNVQTQLSSRFSFVSFESTESATAAKTSEDNRLLPSLTLLKDAPLRISYAEVEGDPRATTPAVFQRHMKDVGVAETQGVTVPGLILMEDFVTEEEERALVDEADSRQWEQLKVRRVQQFGFEFIFSCRNVDPSVSIDSFPPPFREVATRISRTPEAGIPEIDQLTINDYPVGAGIGSHIDTHSAFEDGIASLSLGSSSVMVFAKKGVSIANPAHNDPDAPLTRALFLPPRSLLILTGEARYFWSHGIPFRDSDVDGSGALVHRSRRISLTFRKARGTPCRCPYKGVCDTSPLTEEQ